jgi:hypothetical protein
MYIRAWCVCNNIVRCKCNTLLHAGSNYTLDIWNRSRPSIPLEKYARDRLACASSRTRSSRRIIKLPTRRSSFANEASGETNRSNPDAKDLIRILHLNAPRIISRIPSSSFHSKCHFATPSITYHFRSLSPFFFLSLSLSL